MSSTELSDAALGHAAHSRTADQHHSLPGAFQRPVSITMLGAASHFTIPLMYDILAIPNAPRGHIALVDIDPDRLKPMLRVVELLAHMHGKADGWTITATTDRRDALPGSDYLINAIDVAGLECVRADHDIPLKFGIDQCIGDTVGPGGLFKALRTAPAWLDILRDAQDLCPDAWVLNYTNPMSILCLAAFRATRMRVLGLCHSVQLTSRKLAHDAEVPYEQMRWECAGINHLAWFTQLEHDGRDLYPRLREKTQHRAGDTYESDPVRYEMMLHFGAFITESSGHLSEYLPYFRKSPAHIHRYCREGYRGESGFYADNWPKWRQQQDAERWAILRGEQTIEQQQRSIEYASWIIEAREKNVPHTIHASVLNTHEQRPLITNLPADSCVEVACDVSAHAVTPQRFGALPAQMVGVCQSNLAMIELAAQACLEKSKEAAMHALLLDPLTAAICTPEQISDLTCEMFDAQQDWLPGYR